MTVTTCASERSIRRFVITEKAPNRAFYWLKAATTAFTFKTLIRQYAKQVNPLKVDVKLGQDTMVIRDRQFGQYRFLKPPVGYDLCSQCPKS